MWRLGSQARCENDVGVFFISSYFVFNYPRIPLSDPPSTAPEECERKIRPPQPASPAGGVGTGIVTGSSEQRVRNRFLFPAYAEGD